MTLRELLLLIVIAVLPMALVADVRGQEEQGIGERIGEQLDEGLQRLGRELQRGWAEVRQSLDRLGVQGRVYSRLRWDKGVSVAAIDIQIQDDDIVVLTGAVPSEAAQKKAVQLAQDTVGVREVVDRLRVVPPRPQTTEALGR